MAEITELKIQHNDDGSYTVPPEKADTISCRGERYTPLRSTVSAEQGDMAKET